MIIIQFFPTLWMRRCGWVSEQFGGVLVDVVQNSRFLKDVLSSIPVPTSSDFNLENVQADRGRSKAFGELKRVKGRRISRFHPCVRG